MRYKLLAYVCDGGAVRYTGNYGTLDFHEIFVNRENMCRWAVMFDEREGKYIVADLYNCVKIDEFRMVYRVGLGEHQVFNTEEEAMMCGFMQS